jgi:hypothetical protein
MNTVCTQPSHFVLCHQTLINPKYFQTREKQPAGDTTFVAIFNSNQVARSAYYQTVINFNNLSVYLFIKFNKPATSLQL